MQRYNQTNIAPYCARQSAGRANQLFVSIVQTFLAAQCSISPPEMWPRDEGPRILKCSTKQHYDFIVIGAGSAGATVAGRLAEMTNWNVLLLEAGGNPPIEAEVPFMYTSLFKTRYDWNFHINTSQACQLNYNGCNLPRGKMLGGTSGMNGMIYVRGNEQDFQEWVDAGNPDWSYPNVLEYFKKSEGNTYQPFARNTRYHSGSGPLKVGFFGDLSSNDKLFLNAAMESGIPCIEDYNADNLTGILNLQGTIDESRRQSSAKAFLRPVRYNRNLHVVRNAFVDKILFDKNNRASGVKFTYKRKHKLEVKVTKEVILSAGAIMSPVVLMRSGIGPKKQLDKYNITCRTNLPVGKNLIDHVNVRLFFTYNSSQTPSAYAQEDGLYQFMTKNTGPLVSKGRLQAYVSSTGAKYPDYQLNFVYYPRGTSDLKNSYGSDTSFLPLIAENQLRDVQLISVILIKPKSRGYVRLNNKCASYKPIIDTKYLQHPDDVETMLRALKNTTAFVDTNALQGREGRLYRIPMTECDQFPYQSDDYWRCYIKNQSGSSLHEVGTSRMGTTDSVVDSRLRVYNVKGLRQADAGM